MGKNKVEPREMIDRTPFKGVPIEDIKDLVDASWERFSEGSRGVDLRSPLEMRGLKEVQVALILDMARTRKKALEKTSMGHRTFFTSEGLRWATPEEASLHCADRIRGEHVIDVSCGQGGQAVYLARRSDRVTAVDLDPLNCLVTYLNAEVMGVDNMAIVNGDSLSDAVVLMAGNGCLVFSDPARPPGAKKRTLKEMDPNPLEIHSRYSGMASGFCFELPPYMELDRIPFDMEAEYISLNGRLNRLNLYIGDLKKAERSVVMLPGGAVTSGSPGVAGSDDDSIIATGSYISEMDHSLVRSGLAWKLTDNGEGSIVHLDRRRSILVGSGQISSPFAGPPMKVLGTAEDLKGVKHLLGSVGAGAVTIRFRVEPSEYWKVRNDLESDLSGKEKVNLFKGRRYIVTSREGGQ
ncbi:MAG: hypothetical protein U9R75_11390 [Candidatus Thermoplasmatota archaeon]|nr:hypothetical protein [Candidatus Thermoplasmatota archaeon]